MEEAGHLPPYIERIAKHLRSDQGYSTSRAIATAVNTVKRWARGGTVTKGGTNKVNADTQAKAARALASWKRKANMASPRRNAIELALKDVGSADPKKSQRDKWAKEGIALEDGSFPIPDKKYLIRAIKAYGRADKSKRGKVKRHILKRARALSASEKVMERARELGMANGTSSGEGPPPNRKSDFRPEKHLRSPQSGQFVPKNQTAAKSESSQRTVEGAIDKMQQGDQKALPDDLGWIEKTKSGFTIVGPNGFRTSVSTVSEAHRITGQIIDSARKDNNQ